MIGDGEDSKRDGGSKEDGDEEWRVKKKEGRKDDKNEKDERWN